MRLARQSGLWSLLGFLAFAAVLVGVALVLLFTLRWPVLFRLSIPILVL